MNKIVVVDYGMGNLRSVAQALRHVAPEADRRGTRTVPPAPAGRINADKGFYSVAEVIAAQRSAS